MLAILLLIIQIHGRLASLQVCSGKKSGYLIREEMRDVCEWVGGLAKALVCDGGSQPTERKGHRRPAYNFFLLIIKVYVGKIFWTVSK